MSIVNHQIKSLKDLNVKYCVKISKEFNLSIKKVFYIMASDVIKNMKGNSISRLRFMENELDDLFTDIFQECHEFNSKNGYIIEDEDDIEHTKLFCLCEKNNNPFYLNGI